MQGWQHNNQEYISDPWFSIWRSPRETIREILDVDPRRHVQVLAVVAGFVEALEWAAENNLGDRFPLLVILLICAAAGAAGGLAFLYGGAWLLQRVGAWLGGKGSFVDVRAAMAWSTVPLIWTLLFWLPAIGVFGIRLFQNQNLDLPEAVMWIAPLLLVAVAAIIIAVWMVYIFVMCLAEAHRFAVWRALVTVSLGLILFIIVAIIFAVPMEMITS